VLNLADILELVDDSLDEGTFAQKQAICQGQKNMAHVLAQFGDEAQSLADNQLEDAGRGGAQRHADTDFGSTLPNQGCQDTIQTDSGEDDGDGGEHADQQELKSRAGLGAFHDGVHRLEFHQHHIGIVVRDGGADGGGELGWVAIDAKRPAVDSSMIDVAVGEVDLFAAGGGEILLRVPPGYVVPNHSHTSDEVYLWLQGSFTYVAADGTQQALGAPAYISLPGNTPHALHCGASPCVFYLRYGRPFDLQVHPAGAAHK